MFAKQLERVKKMVGLGFASLLAGWLVHRGNVYTEHYEPGMVGPTMCVLSAICVLLTAFVLILRPREA